MSFLKIIFLLWIEFMDIQDGAVIHMDHSKHLNGFDYVVQKYLDPLRKLQAELPNHAIEMQIEFHDTLPTYTKSKPQRRVIRVLNPHKPKPVKRSQGENGNAARSAPGEKSKQESSPGYFYSREVIKQPEIKQPEIKQPKIKQRIGEVDANKVPVYMDDLQKALEALEKKLSETTTAKTTAVTTAATTAATEAGKTTNGGASCNGGGGGGGGGGGAIKNVLQTPIRSIENILEILKKAIHIEHREPKPSENLEWVQVKIPKGRK